MAPWEEEHKFCGSGQCIITIDTEGKEYPCHRFASISCARPAEQVDFTFTVIKPEKCASCKIRRLCHSCLGYNYEKYGYINHRTIYHCEFVKLQLKAAALYRIKTIKRALNHEINLTPAELKAKSEAALFIEKHIEPTQEICKTDLIDAKYD